MPAPAKDKTWQYSLNNGPYFGAATLQTNQAMLFAIKGVLLAFGTLPWTVRGSSNSVAAAMDASDRWVASTNLVWAAGAHSWIVLRQTGVAAKFEVCFDLNTSSSEAMTVAVSPSAGFGVANGGTDGTTSARPTATDEVVVNTTSDGWNSGSSNNLHWMHAMQSTDGQCTRIVTLTGSLPQTLMIFDRAKNASANWTGTTAIFGVGASNTVSSVLTSATWLDGKTKLFFRHSTTNGNMYLATPGYVAAAFHRSAGGLVPHDVTKEWPFNPMTLGSDSTSLRGLWGTVYDLYWGSTTLNSLSSYEASSIPHTWQQFGEMIFPWDATTTAKVG